MSKLEIIFWIFLGIALLISIYLAFQVDNEYQSAATILPTAAGK